MNSLNGTLGSGESSAAMFSLTQLQYHLGQATMGWNWFSIGAGLLTLLGGARSSPPLVDRTWNGTEYGCKCYLGDDCWPSDDSWVGLNSTVDGNLVVTIPPGAACHDVRRGQNEPRSYSRAIRVNNTDPYQLRRLRGLLVQSQLMTRLLAQMQRLCSPMNLGSEYPLYRR